MGDEVEKLSGKLGIDTTDFKTALGAANRELRVLESGFRAGSVALGDYSKSADGLEMRAKSLTQQIDIQKLKVAALGAEHARLAQENGATSRSAQDAQIKLNKETETLGKMESELRTTNTSLTDMAKGEKDAGQKADEAGRKIQTLKNILSGVGSVAKAAGQGILHGFGGALNIVGKGLLTGMGLEVKAVTGLLLGLVGTAAIAGTAIMGLALSSAEAADQIATLSDVTGISKERLQELSYAGTQLDVDLETITGASARLIRSMGSAAGGSKPLEQAFKTLGVSVVDAKGNLLDSQAVFASTIDALGKVENPTERDALAMQIFGKSAQELNPLIKAGGDALAKYSAEAHTMGAVVSDEGINALDSFGDMLEGIKSGLKGVGMTIATAFMPGLTGMLDQTKGYLGQLVQIVQTSNGDFGKMAGGILSAITTGLTKAAPEMAKSGYNIIRSLVLSILTNVPTIAPLANIIIQSLATFLTNTVPLLLEAGSAILGQLASVINTQIPLLVPVVLNILQSLMNFITQNLPILIPVAVTIISGLVSFLTENVPMLLSAGTAILGALVDVLLKSLPIILPAVVGILKSMIGFLVQNLPVLLQAGIVILTGLANALLQSLPTLLPAAIGMLMSLVTMLLQNLPMIIRVALQILLALVNGITASLPTLIPVIVDVLLQIVQTLLDNLPMLIDAALKLIVALATGLIKALPVLIPKIPLIIKAIFDALIAALPMITKAAGELISTLILGIIENLPSLIQAAGEILVAIYNAIGPAASLQLMLDIAKGLIDGLIQGWNENWESMIANVAAGFAALVAFIKNLLGIASPSRTMMGIGRNMGLGLGVGLFGALDEVQAKLGASMGGLTLAMTGADGLSFNGATGARGGGRREEFTFINYGTLNFENDLPGGLKEMLTASRY